LAHVAVEPGDPQLAVAVDEEAQSTRIKPRTAREDDDATVRVVRAPALSLLSATFVSALGTSRAHGYHLRVRPAPSRTAVSGARTSRFAPASIAFADEVDAT